MHAHHSFLRRAHLLPTVLDRAKRLGAFSFLPFDRKMNWRKLRSLNLDRVVGSITVAIAAMQVVKERQAVCGLRHGAQNAGHVLVLDLRTCNA